MTPKEIISRLSLLRVEITDRTLYNYSEWKLIPEPQRGAGRAGKWVEYPNSAMAEAYAAWRLLHGDYWKEKNYINMGLKPPRLSPETVATVRRLIEQIDKQDWSQFQQQPQNFEEAVKFTLALNHIFDEAAVILLIGYIRLWQYFKKVANGTVADILDDPEY